MRPLFLILVTTILGACTIDDPVSQSGVFACQDNFECVSGYICEGGTCVSELTSVSGCTDRDGDGWCVGNNLTESAACQTEPSGCSMEDCDDSNDQVFPGATEQCDGVNNDCDAQTDEPVSCADGEPCPNSGDYKGRCNTVNGTCEFVPFLETGGPECLEPLACVDGELEPIPAACL